jgi:hypothetical protein
LKQSKPAMQSEERSHEPPRPTKPETSGSHEKLYAGSTKLMAMHRVPAGQFWTKKSHAQRYDPTTLEHTSAGASQTIPHLPQFIGSVR